MRRSNGRLAFAMITSALVVGFAIPATTLAQAPPRTVALSGARIIPVVGDEIKDGVIIVEDGRIVAIGKAGEVEIPFDAREFDLSGKVVMPGMIDAATTKGLDTANESRPVVPQLSAADALDPSQLALEDALRTGVATMHVLPGSNTVIGGTGVVIRPIGMSVPDMTIAPGEFLRLAVSPRRGSNRMSQLAALREAFAKLTVYLENLAESKYEDKLKEDEEDIEVGPAEARMRGLKLLEADDLDREHRNLLRLIGGVAEVEGEKTEQLIKPLGAFIHCQQAMDVPAALAIAKEHGFLSRTVLTLGPDCYKAVDALKKSARPVVLDGNLIDRDVNPLTGEETETFVPEKIADAGLLFALTPGTNASLPERMLTYQAARCVRNGVPRATALRAITINPAKILGLEDRLGSLEVGKSANVVVFSGDPLDFASKIEMVFIEGIPAYERSKDPRLQRLLSAATSDEQKAAE